VNKKNLLIFLGIILAVCVAAAVVIAVSVSVKNRHDPDSTPGPDSGHEYLERFDEFSCVTVAAGANPATAVNFCWQTYNGIADGFVRYAKKEGSAVTLPAETAKVEAYSENTTFSVPVDGQFDYKNPSLQDVPAVLHRVYLTGLEPATEYVYTVGGTLPDGTITESEPAVFRTVPEGDTFSFLLVADTQGFTQRNYDVWGSLLSLALEKLPGFDFTVHMGDTVEEGKNAYQWQMYYNSSSGILGKIPTVSVVGNKDKKHALSHFTNGADGNRTALVSGYYSFDVGSVHFSVLNTGDGDKDLPKAQLKWLKADLEAAADKHKIILIHKAPYSDANHCFDAEIVAIRSQILPVANDYGVAAVLEGHDHYFFRSVPVNGQGAAADYNVSTVAVGGVDTKMFSVNGNGTVYFVNGSAGCRQHDNPIPGTADVLTDYSALMKGASLSYVSVDGEKIVFTTYVNENGTLKLYDSWGLYF
jgi:hypothetical protein